MTAAARLVDDAHRLHVRLVPEGPKLRVIGPADLPDREWNGLVEGLTAFKGEILLLLLVRARSPPPEPAAAVRMTWDELAALRWGGADDSPGMTIDVPNRERMMAALEAVLDSGTM